MDISDEKIKQIYSLARKVASRVMHKYRVSYLDEEDFVQEAVMGWLEGRNLYLAAMDALRKYGPLTKDEASRKVRPPEFIDSEDPDLILTSGTGPSSMEHHVLSSQILDIILSIDDREEQYAVLASYFGDLSLQDISHDLGYRSKRSAFELRRKGLDHIREKLGVTTEND